MGLKSVGQIYNLQLLTQLFYITAISLAKVHLHTTHQSIHYLTYNLMQHKLFILLHDASQLRFNFHIGTLFGKLVLYDYIGSILLSFQHHLLLSFRRAESHFNIEQTQILLYFSGGILSATEYSTPSLVKQEKLNLAQYLHSIKTQPYVMVFLEHLQEVGIHFHMSVYHYYFCLVICGTLIVLCFKIFGLVLLYHH